MNLVYLIQLNFEILVDLDCQKIIFYLNKNDYEVKSKLKSAIKIVII